MSKQKVGQLFMFGFEGSEPTNAILDFIRNEGLRGVIIFKRNITSEDGLRELVSELRDAGGNELLVGIDQEGGRVSNMPPSVINVPPIAEFGRRYLEHGDTNEVYGLGRGFGEKLLSFGINVDFAPVLDVVTNDKNTVIGDRSFGTRPEVVAALGCAFAKGLRDAGVIACGKHFPGHGDTLEDSHKTLPKLAHDRERLDRVELVPFKMAIKEGIPSIMSAHVIYEGVDPENPATLSKKILTDILRDELSFDGVIFSDDLEMNAISEVSGIGEATVRALAAGCDISLICKTEARQMEAITAMKKAIDDGRISSKRFEEAMRRRRGALLVP